jgi:cytochrome d ubiquinol oxidase subunit II
MPGVAIAEPVMVLAAVSAETSGSGDASVTANAVAAVMFAAVVLYAVFGGADFGSGVWDLTAGGSRQGAPVRRLIDQAIGPVWEANHVWLVFILVFLWSGFPSAFTALMQDLAVPFWLAALGIVARGAGFAFRKYAPSLGWARTAGVVFAGSSMLTPFFFGMIAGAVASGSVTADGTAGPWEAWTTPTSWFGGLLAVAVCTFLAGVLLTADAHRLQQWGLVDELRAKSLAGGLLTGVMVLAGIPILVAEDEQLVDGLLGRGLPLVLASAVGGLAALYLLWQRRYRQARYAAAIAVAAVVTGWGVAQYPWILVDQLTVGEAAGAPATLIGLLVATGLAAVLVVPSLAYLFYLADTARPAPASDAAPSGRNHTPSATAATDAPH